MEPGGEPLGPSDRSGPAGEDQEDGLEGVLSGVAVVEELPETRRTIGPCRQTRPSKASSALSPRRIGPEARGRRGRRPSPRPRAPGASQGRPSSFAILRRRPSGSGLFLTPYWDVAAGCFQLYSAIDGLCRSGGNLAQSRGCEVDPPTRWIPRRGRPSASTSTPRRWPTRFGAFAVALATLALMVATEPRMAIVWDEGFTLGREARIREWFRALANPPAFASRWVPPSPRSELVQPDGLAAAPAATRSTRGPSSSRRR